MSESSASHVSVHDVSLEPIMTAIREALPTARHEEALAFADAFYGRMSAEEFDVRPAGDWAALARDFLEFARERPAGKPVLRVFNPTQGEHGWSSAHTVVQVVNDDMPFLVDSVSMALALSNVSIHVLGHPVVEVERDAGGALVGLGRGQRESLLHIEIDLQTDPDVLATMIRDIETALSDVRMSVADWAAMRNKARAIAEELAGSKVRLSAEAMAETQEFLAWAADDHFTFLGYREYEVRHEAGDQVLAALPGTGLGLLKGEERIGKPRSLKTLIAHTLSQNDQIDALILTKTNARSTVHRPGYMDYIGVLRFDAQGEPVGEHRFVGLYTSAAYNRRPWDIPLVRQRFEYVMKRSGLPRDGHSGKALKHILESLPRDELFQSSDDELFQTCMGILSLQERIRPRLFLRRDRYGRFFSALVYIPRDRFNTDTRLRIEAMLMEALNGQRIDTTIQVGDLPLAQLHLIIRPKAGGAEFNVAELEQRLVELVRNWHDDLRDILIERRGAEDGLKLSQRFGRALPGGYIERATPEVAANDVEHLSRLEGPQDLRLALYRSGEDASQVHFKLYRQGEAIALSDALPMMENMGLRIVAEHPFEVHADGMLRSIQDFSIELPGGEIDVGAVREVFEDAFEQVWRGTAESDGFNRLVLVARLDWREVAMLRAYCKYLLQAGVPFSQAYMESTLCRYPLLARLLVELFEARFDPAREGEGGEQARESLQRELDGIHDPTLDENAHTIIEEVAYARGLDRSAQADAALDALAILLERVSSIDEDRILRSFIGVIEATLRTSYFQCPDGTYRDYLAFKFDPGLIPELPRPRPYRETFVCSPRVEGVHLRFGKVARGGLRWSDRREDFRTEVLGLVKAQMVKNTVIVPVGAKGGFIVKQPPAASDREAFLAEGVACYRMFINGLLDIADNYAGDTVVHPVGVVRRDDDDPYLVVAADKGTATFSDIANGISLEHGYWLGDAFASGGSVGYDHKGMGITAKGAWESVKRHFRALGIDSQTQDFTAVGIGDMSGDVFGNGMLLSRHIRLVAAFDHRHIFIDPNPDSAASYAERERLFQLPRSSWEDYDRALVSSGGGIFARSMKSIPLSEEARSALGIDESVTQMTPNELMNAILKAPVDLLWNGGIGTYVKAASESHEDVGDRANNGLRVNGGELRCRVVGEGGNLGLTQRGRIEAALQAGVLLNTDFIDNSAGVDTSDHEVNIKILLNAVMQRGDLGIEDRNALLAEMTDEVASLVLVDNYRQNQAISLMERMSVSRLGSKQHFIRTLESRGLLDRQLEFLPSESEFEDRRSRGLGLTRPELSVLLSYAKLVAFDQLLHSDVPEDPYLSRELLRYFPQPLQERFADLMEDHRLRREIIATAVTNSTINRMGATFLMRMQEDTGQSPAQIAKAYTITREVLDARELWAQIDELDLRVPESSQIDALQRIWALQRGMTRWLLNRPGQSLGIADQVERYKPGMDALREALPEVLGEEDREAFEADRHQWLGAGFPDAMATQLAALAWLESGMDIVEVAGSSSERVGLVARVHFRFGQVMHLSWLAHRIDELPVGGRWHALARGALRDELQAQHRGLVALVLEESEQAGPEAVDAWLARDDATLGFTRQMLDELRSQRTMDYPTLSVAVRLLAQTVAAEQVAA
ncbi:NAD-glutamate dehydrogenase [Alkalisalibacterium limincola]|uniref:NAD-glutamate dehydrogenase n=1 Tax=Alkalisalibacterium limincola TaxID=2699169 RepID=A0A5C8L0B5_9GAMM|nr:NAD-glutamate dehydrogenase domain-containing protein [Alkalisalibacterium limincola]TXK65675.1 NAD-glutamate dehydrogenase [Alkalisalibacterium limincola]